MRILGVSRNNGGGKVIVVAEAAEGEKASFEDYTVTEEAIYDKGNGLTTYILAKPPTLEEAKKAKIKEIGAECSQAIYNGFRIGDKNYSLTEHDQIEILAQTLAIMTGAETVPYHADGELCRMMPADEFKEIAAAAARHVLWHRTYCNHLNARVRRAETAEEMEGVDYKRYSENLPDDLKENMNSII